MSGEYGVTTMSYTQYRFGRWVAAMAAGAALWACGATGAGEARAQVAGVRVNGVDVSAGSGEGWSRAGDDVILQRNGMTYVVDGESSDGSVRIVIMGNCTMVASNLVLSGGTPVSVYNGYSPVLELAGTNSFSGGGDCAGLGVPAGRSIRRQSGDGRSLPYAQVGSVWYNWDMEECTAKRSTHPFLAAPG